MNPASDARRPVPPTSAVACSVAAAGPPFTYVVFVPVPCVGNQPLCNCIDTPLAQMFAGQNGVASTTIEPELNAWNLM